MYNKHTNTKIEFQVIIDNKVCVAFNTDKKRNAFMDRLKDTRKVTCIGNVEYPWNPEDGIHNLISSSDFAKRVGIEDVNRVTRAIKKGKIETEMLGEDTYIVEKNGYFRINGVLKYMGD